MSHQIDEHDNPQIVDRSARGRSRQNVQQSQQTSIHTRQSQSNINIQQQQQQLQQQQQQQAALKSELTQKFEQYNNKYKKLHDFILIRGIVQIKEELTPLLYYIYIFLFFEIYHREQNPELAHRFLLLHKEDFNTIPSFIKQINYLETLPKMNLKTIKEGIEQLSKTDPIMKEILDHKIITLSPYSNDVFEVFLKKNGLYDISNALQESMHITIRISKDPITESNLPSNLVVSTMQLTDIDKLNQNIINLAPMKDDLSFKNKLDSIYNIQKKTEQGLTTKKLKDKLSDIEQKLKDENYIEKSNIPLPEIKPKNRIDLIKNYLERQYLDEYNEPSIMSISINDPLEYCTCVDIQRSGNIIVFGFNDAMILLFTLNPSYDYANFLEKNKKKQFGSIKRNAFNANIDDDMNIEKNIKEENKERLTNVNSSSNESNIGKEKFTAIEFVGHEDAITSISILYDELYFISSSVDTTIRLWCIRQRTCLSIFRGHVNNIWKVKFCPKGYYFASGSSDCTARLWTTDKNKTPAIRIFTGHTSDVHLVEFSDNINYLITGSYDKSIRIWDISSGSCCKILLPNNEVTSCLSLSNSGKYLLTGSESGLIILWNMENGVKLNHFYIENNKRVLDLSFSIDETYCVGATKNRISYYLLERIKNDKGDMLRGLQKINGLKDDKQYSIKKDNLALNYFENQETDLLLVRFGVSNFIYSVGRSTIN